MKTVKGLKVVYSFFVKSILKQLSVTCPIETQHYLSPDTVEHAPPWSHPHRLVLNLSILEEWKAELTLVVRYNISTWFTCLFADSRPFTIDI